MASYGGSAGTGPDAGAADGEVLASSDASCDVAGLWRAISEAARVIGYCFLTPAGNDGSVIITAWGEVIIDSEGRVIDNTRLSSASKQAWLSSLADYRWPCLAGQSLQYSCVTE